MELEKYRKKRQIQVCDAFSAFISFCAFLFAITWSASQQKCGMNGKRDISYEIPLWDQNAIVSVFKQESIENTICQNKIHDNTISIGNCSNPYEQIAKVSKSDFFQYGLKAWQDGVGAEGGYCPNTRSVYQIQRSWNETQYRGSVFIESATDNPAGAMTHFLPWVTLLFIFAFSLVFQSLRAYSIDVKNPSQIYPENNQPFLYYLQPSLAGTLPAYMPLSQTTALTPNSASEQTVDATKKLESYTIEYLKTVWSEAIPAIQKSFKVNFLSIQNAIFLIFLTVALLVYLPVLIFYDFLVGGPQYILAISIDRTFLDAVIPVSKWLSSSEATKKMIGTYNPGEPDFWRWLEYALTSPLQILIISTSVLIQDRSTVFNLMGLQCALVLLGYLNEVLIQKGWKKLGKGVFDLSLLDWGKTFVFTKLVVTMVLSFLFYIIIWWTIISRFDRQVDNQDKCSFVQKMPDEVYFIIITQSLLFLAFGYVQLYQVYELFVQKQLIRSNENIRRIQKDNGIQLELYKIAKNEIKNNAASPVQSTPEQLLILKNELEKIMTKQTDSWYRAAFRYSALSVTAKTFLEGGFIALAAFDCQTRIHN